MKLHAVILFLLSLVTFCAGCQPGAPKPTMAVMSTREVITKCNAGLKAAEEVRGKFAPRQEALKKQEEAIEKLKADPAASDQKSGKRAELDTLTRQYVADAQTLRRDIGEEEAARFKPVVDKINKALDAYAKEHGLFSVQDKNGFAYVSPAIDITDEIIRLVDEVK